MLKATAHRLINEMMPNDVTCTKETKDLLMECALGAFSRMANVKNFYICSVLRRTKFVTKMAKKQLLEITLSRHFKSWGCPNTCRQPRRSSRDINKRARLKERKRRQRKRTRTRECRKRNWQLHRKPCSIKQRSVSCLKYLRHPSHPLLQLFLYQ